MKRIAVAGWMALTVVAAGASVVVHVLEGPVVVRHQVRVARKVDAMPVVVAGPAVIGEAAAKINAALRRLDATVRTAEKGCRGNNKEWARTVEVTMRGPRYLSLTATDDVDCGGAHPDEDFLPLVYDLKTGGTVNWLKLLPPGVSSGVDDAADGNKVGAVIWPELTRRARAGAEDECKEVFDGVVPFVLWLDARAGAVKAEPFGLARAVVACAVPLSITATEARGMGGFNVEMLDALEAARGMQR